MPELPEVELFRTLLEPLVSTNQPLQFERGTLDRQPPRKFVSDDEIAHLNGGNYHLIEVMRKGKQIAMVLESKTTTTTTKTKTKTKTRTRYLMVHMGMTGRISTPEHVPKLESLASNDYPPPHTYLKFTAGDLEACFSDPRKFGKIELLEETADLETVGFGGLAPDAWKDLPLQLSTLVEKVAHRVIGIKPLLLDQKRVVCGVGNWVVDEVLYQTALHPDQNYLTEEQARKVLETLHDILSTAVECLVTKRTEVPSDWLFHYRWNSKKTTKDAQGRTVTFITSGGRTSAIVPSLQMIKSQRPTTTAAAAATKAKATKKKKRSTLETAPEATFSETEVTIVKSEETISSSDTKTGTDKRRKKRAKSSVVITSTRSLPEEADSRGKRVKIEETSSGVVAITNEGKGLRRSSRLEKL